MDTICTHNTFHTSRHNRFHRSIRCLAAANRCNALTHTYTHAHTNAGHAKQPKSNCTLTSSHSNTPTRSKNEHKDIACTLLTTVLPHSATTCKRCLSHTTHQNALNNTQHKINTIKTSAIIETRNKCTPSCSVALSQNYPHHKQFPARQRFPRPGEATSMPNV